ncbi:MAG: hypothetical protein KDJ27_04735 [Gammaproteobacteria bacterium]|nr:hypothetical protein [Gammaproteobacteria bacterium]
MNTTIGIESLPAPLRSSAQLRQLFEHGLADMLEADVLGAFVLVLANACYEQAMFERLRQPLRVAFERWCRRFDEGDAHAVDAAIDDVTVFRAVRAAGFDALGVTDWRRVGPWQLQFNALRALRPARASAARISGLQRAFDADGFHFNKPFLRREVLWEGAFAGTALRLLYNKFPFAELHGLLVPDPGACLPQFLTHRYHALAWRLLEQCSEALPGAGLAYNALGAQASVNHLHFQLFVRGDDRYPIEAAEWQHNGGEQIYPVPVGRFTDAELAWATLSRLHELQQPYNLIYRPGVLYVVLRAAQGTVAAADWSMGFAWAELAGAITLSDAQVFATIGNDDVTTQMACHAAHDEAKAALRL